MERLENAGHLQAVKQTPKAVIRAKDPLGMSAIAFRVQPYKLQIPKSFGAHAYPWQYVYIIYAVYRDNFVKFFCHFFGMCEVDR